jgi:predicted ATP-grasp superfamily ATP-dependent carboligase
VKQNQRISAEEVAAELKNDLDVNVRTGTVHNFLRSRGFHGRVARRKHFVSEANRKKTLEFAKKYTKTPMEYCKGSFSQVRINLTYLVPTDTAQYGEK